MKLVHLFEESLFEGLNIVNPDGIAEFIREPAERAGSEIATKWFTNKVGDYVRSQKTGLQPLDDVPPDAPDWMRAAFDRGDELARFVGDDRLHDHLMHIADFLAWQAQNDPREHQKILKRSLEQVRQDTDEWVAARNREAQDRETEGDVREVMKFDNGLRWVQLQTPQGFDREGRLMGHCVGSYAERVLKPGTNQKVYSLRDAKNQPHVTMHVIEGVLDQCKGKGNAPPVARYVPAVKALLNTGRVRAHTQSYKTRDTEEIGLFHNAETGRWGGVENFEGEPLDGGMVARRVAGSEPGHQRVFFTPAGSGTVMAQLNYFHLSATINGDRSTMLPLLIGYLNDHPELIGDRSPGFDSSLLRGAGIVANADLRFGPVEDAASASYPLAGGYRAIQVEQPARTTLFVLFDPDGIVADTLKVQRGRLLDDPNEVHAAALADLANKALGQINPALLIRFNDAGVYYNWESKRWTTLAEGEVRKTYPNGKKWIENLHRGSWTRWTLVDANGLPILDMMHGPDEIKHRSYTSDGNLQDIRIHQKTAALESTDEVSDLLNDETADQRGRKYPRVLTHDSLNGLGIKHNPKTGLYAGPSAKKVLYRSGEYRFIDLGDDEIGLFNTENKLASLKLAKRKKQITGFSPAGTGARHFRPIPRETLVLLHDFMTAAGLKLSPAVVEELNGYINKYDSPLKDLTVFPDGIHRIDDLNYQKPVSTLPDGRQVVRKLFDASLNVTYGLGPVWFLLDGGTPVSALAFDSRPEDGYVRNRRGNMHWGTIKHHNDPMIRRDGEWHHIDGNIIDGHQGVELTPDERALYDAAVRDEYNNPGLLTTGRRR
jgi:hypothetical protein